MLQSIVASTPPQRTRSLTPHRRGDLRRVTVKSGKEALQRINTHALIYEKVSTRSRASSSKDLLDI
jgi:hypothetical protein